MEANHRGRAAGVSAAAVLVVAVALGVPTLVTHPRAAAERSSAAASHRRAAWTTSWAAMPQLTEPANMPPAPFTGSNQVLVDTTLRQTVHVSLGGRTVRLRFSNAFGGAPLPITRVTIALPTGGQAGVSAIRPDSTRPVTFAGHRSTLIPTGALAVSDPIAFAVAPLTNVTVTAYLATGQASTNITSHPGSRTTSYLMRGDETQATDLAHATATEHWYFLSGLEVRRPSQPAVVDVVGDSLSDGRGSTTNGNDRWPDDLARRLVPRGSGVINEAAGGNRVLNDGLGPNVLARFDRDVLAQSGVTSAILFEGVNDIGTADATPAAQRAVEAQLVAAYEQLIRRAHAQGIRLIGATITPFGGNTMYDDPGGLREATREAVNHWIRTSGEFDAVLDFDRGARDPQHPSRLRPAYDVGDHLHLNPLGYRALADSVRLTSVNG